MQSRIFVGSLAIALTFTLGSGGLHALAQAGIQTAEPAAGARLPAAIGDAMQPDFLRRDLNLFQQELRLTKDQQIAVEALFSDYESAFKTGTDRLRERWSQWNPEFAPMDPEKERRREGLRDRLAEILEQLDEVRDAGDGEAEAALMERLQQELRHVEAELKSLQPPIPSAEERSRGFERASADITEWLSQKSRLRQSFLTDVQTLLTKEQTQLWPPFERKLVREKTLRNARLSGEAADLFEIVNGARLDEASKQKIQPVLDEYSIKLDIALRMRNDFILRSQRDLVQATQSGNDNAALEIVKKQIWFRTDVRDVNDRFAQKIADQLSATEADKFLAHYHARAYPRIFRPTQTQRMIAAARALPTITNKQALDLHALEEGHLSLLSNMNQMILLEFRNKEPHAQIARAKARLQGGQPEPDPTNALFIERTKSERMLAKLLEEILSPEQLKSIPKLPDEPAANE